MNAPALVRTAAVALIRSDDRVLMVRSLYPGDDEPFWALPGGAVDEGEDLSDALMREIREETGLSIQGPGTIAAIIWLETSDGSPDQVTFVCEPPGSSGDLRVDDPDGVTLEAAFVDVGEATERLSSLRWGLGEPIVRRLEGAPAGAIWTYGWDGAGPWDGPGPARLVRAPAGAAERALR